MSPGFEPWFMAGAALLRCKECGALVISSDIALHQDWHATVEK